MIQGIPFNTQLSSIWHITKVFVAVKTVLFLILYFQFTEYDTSSSTLLFPEPEEASSAGLGWQILQQIAKRLCIWDTVFHVTAAQNVEGVPLYEHEWAFGIGWSRVVRQAGLLLIRLFGGDDNKNDIYYYVLGATMVSTLSHYFACIVLYFLTLQIHSAPRSPYLIDLLQQARTPSGGNLSSSSVSTSELKAAQEEEKKKRDREHKKVLLTSERVARKTAALFALTPAGMFMAAGYAESTFALLSFCAILLRENQFYTASGALFAGATLLRSNGLLWGLLFLGDLATVINGLIQSWGSPSKRALRGELFITGIQVIIGGLMIGAAFFGIQYYAYTIYCTSSSTSSAEWCTNRIPLIYSYIQSKYWGVGFLRYWTPNNIPNFLFAFPTLAIMWKSGCYYSYYLPKSIKTETSVPSIGENERAVLRKIEYYSPYLTVQLLMFFSCILTWHVQIITRVGSCLPVLYWYTAEMLMSTQLAQVKTGKIIVRYFIVWIVVQGIFFSAFLPPA